MHLSRGFCAVLTAVLILVAAGTSFSTVKPVDIGDFFFSPDTITVSVGDTVRWTNIGAMTHTTTSDTPLWDSGPMSNGAVFDFQFGSAGSFPYHCTFHSAVMKGVVNVVAGIPCEDITSMAARCIGGGTKTIQVRVNLLNNIIHAGEMVTITIDGTPFSATIITNGTHSRANFSVPGWSAGNHVVSLIDPAGCLPDVHPVCAAGDGGVGTDPQWESDALWEPEGSGEDATKLIGNYPNPFNPESSIRYALGEPAHVSLNIYNTVGQLIRTLVNDFQDKGYYEAVWDGTNESGATVASGIYVYRLVAGGFVETRKMLLMK